MSDFAISEDAGVQAQLDRLGQLSLPRGRLGLGTVQVLCGRVGDPQDHMPPVFHVAGTNGKGSTCTFLRAILEADGRQVHTATKPHLVRYNERIRLAGKLIDDTHLADLLKEVLDAADGLQPSFFEVTTIATFLAFSRIHADACVIETGLGGRLDATNILTAPAVCGIASLGIDHEAFLLTPDVDAPSDPLQRIAFEKAGIAKSGTPLVTQGYSEEVCKVIEQIARAKGAPLLMRGRDWDATIHEGIEFHDSEGSLILPRPLLLGEHQCDNTVLAVAMLRHQHAIEVAETSLHEGITSARWPARMQRLADGPLTRLCGRRAVWLDGGHNPDAGRAINRYLADQPPVHLVIGMLANKDPSAIVGPLEGRVLSISVVPAPGHDAHPPEHFARFSQVPVRNFTDVAAALSALPPEGDALIAGSLYLAGDVLRRNEEIPD